MSPYGPRCGVLNATWEWAPLQQTAAPRACLFALDQGNVYSSQERLRANSYSYIYIYIYMYTQTGETYVLTTGIILESRPGDRCPFWGHLSPPVPGRPRKASREKQTKKHKKRDTEREKHMCPTYACPHLRLCPQAPSPDAMNRLMGSSY